MLLYFIFSHERGYKYGLNSGIKAAISERKNDGDINNRSK